MTKEQTIKKPLSCWYCEQSKHSTGLSYFYSIPAFPECTCFDVPYQLVDLWQEKGIHEDNNLYTWLPYHCGHFSPRKIKLRCKNTACKKPVIISEWELVKYMLIGPCCIIVCSLACKSQVQKGG